MIIGVALVILGVWVMFTDEPLIQNILRFIGIVLMVFGAIQIVMILVKKDRTLFPGENISVACMNLLLGLVFFVAANVIMSTLNLFLGIWIAAIGVIKISVNVSMSGGFHLKENLVGILCFIIGILVITTPVLTITTVKILVGIFLIIWGLSNIIIYFTTKPPKDTIQEAEIISEKKNKK